MPSCSKLDAVHRYFQLALDEPSSKLTTFDPQVKTVVLTGASCLHGIGFALVQVYKDELALIQ